VSKHKKEPNFKFIDLFSGIGGFHHALEHPDFGGECVWSVDIDADCHVVYESTWPEMVGKMDWDIREFTTDANGKDLTRAEIAKRVPDHDVLCAGFPCQPFSKSGMQLGVMDSTRGTLFFDIAKIVEAKKPRFLILENVRNLAGPRHTETWKTIIATLRELGYRVSDEPVIYSPHLLPPELGGRPQVRERVFILATRSTLKHSLSEEPLVKHSPIGDWSIHHWNIEDYLQDDSDIEDISKYKLRKEEIAWLNAWNDFIKGIESDDLPGFPIWVDAFTKKPRIPEDTPKWKSEILIKNSDFYKENEEFIRQWLSKSWMKNEIYRVADFPASRRKFEWQARSAQPTRKKRDIWKLTIHFRPSGVRVKPATYLPALVAITQTSIIGSRKRRITPIEAGRLQGLPDWVFPESGVDDSSAYKQSGNAVNVGVVKFVAAQLFKKSKLNWGESLFVNQFADVLEIEETE
jgi:DNA (cytosine-5)-methyltransferase 1